jgi:hypothetical protein
MPAVDAFLEARLREDTELPADDVEAKYEIISLYQIASESAELDRDAWLVLKHTLFLLCSRYAQHPDYSPAWGLEDVPQRHALGIDQPTQGHTGR